MAAFSVIHLIQKRVNLIRPGCCCFYAFGPERPNCPTLSHSCIILERSIFFGLYLPYPLSAEPSNQHYTVLILRLNLTFTGNRCSVADDL